MRKKLIIRSSALALAVMLIFASVFCAFAEITQTYAITDDAAVFSADEAASLAVKLDEAGSRTGWQFIVHTSNDGISGDDALERHYNDYYDSQSFAYDAIMLVIDRGSGLRDLLTYGDVRAYFKDSSRYDIIKDAMRPYLEKDDMVGATEQFIEKAVEVHDMGKTSALVLSLRKYGWIAGIASVIAGLAFFLANRSRYKNMGKAGTYDLKANSSVDLRDVEDDFVTQHTTVRTIREDNDRDSGSSHSGGGNSSGGF